MQNNVKKASEYLKSISDAFFGRLVRSEVMVIKTDGLVVSLKKVSSDDVKGLNMNEGQTKINLPGNLGIMASGDVNAKVKPTGGYGSVAKLKQSILHV